MKVLMILAAGLMVSALGFAQSPGSTGSSGGSMGSGPSTTGLDTPVGTYGAPAGPTGTSKAGDALSNRPINPQVGTSATGQDLHQDKFAKSPHGTRKAPKDVNAQPADGRNQDSTSGSYK